MRSVFGVGQVKLDLYGESFIARIASYCREHQVAMDREPPKCDTLYDLKPQRPRENQRLTEAVRMFQTGASIDDVAEKLSLAPSTIEGYLVQYIQQARVTDVSNWVEPSEQPRIEIAVRYAALVGQLEKLRLKPIHDAFHGQVSYTQIRLVLYSMLNACA